MTLPKSFGDENLTNHFKFCFKKDSAQDDYVADQSKFPKLDPIVTITTHFKAQYSQPNMGLYETVRG